MKLISCLSIVVICLTLLVNLTNATAPTLHDTVPSHLHKSGLFYRGVYKADIQSIGKTYVKGKSPPSHSKDAGDFAPKGVGGFYVFDNEVDAEEWGRYYSDGTSYKTFHVATFQYTPKSELKTKSFTSADANWLHFVESNYAATTKTSPYAIVEGPISAPVYKDGKKIKVGYSKNGRLVWQGAFITPEALNTLHMTNIKQYTVADKKKSATCDIQ